MEKWTFRACGKGHHRVFFSSITTPPRRTRPIVKKALAIIAAVTKEVARHPDYRMPAVGAVTSRGQPKQNRDPDCFEAAHYRLELEPLRNSPSGRGYMTLPHSPTRLGPSFPARVNPKGRTDFGRESSRDDSACMWGCVACFRPASSRRRNFGDARGSPQLLAPALSNMRGLTDERPGAGQERRRCAHQLGQLVSRHAYASGAMRFPGTLQQSAHRKPYADDPPPLCRAAEIDEDKVSRLGRIPSSGF